jgi:hypothetical protein
MFKKIAGVAVVSALAASMSGCFLSVISGSSIASKTTAVNLTGYTPVKGVIADFYCQKDAKSPIQKVHGTTVNSDAIQLSNWKAPVYGNTAQYNKALPASCWKQNANNNSTLLSLWSSYDGKSNTWVYTYDSAGLACLQSSVLYQWEVDNGNQIDVAFRGFYCNKGVVTTLYAPL